jgi:hypothetical protein
LAFLIVESFASLFVQTVYDATEPSSLILSFGINQHAGGSEPMDLFAIEVTGVGKVGNSVVKRLYDQSTMAGELFLNFTEGRFVIRFNL